jgi:hypothetical protein
VEFGYVPFKFRREYAEGIFGILEAFFQLWGICPKQAQIAFLAIAITAIVGTTYVEVACPATVFTGFPGRVVYGFAFEWFIHVI